MPPNRLLIIRFYILVFALLLSLSPWRGRGLTRSDPQFYFQVGQELLHGKVPYRDIYEHKPPLILLTGVLHVLAGSDKHPIPWIDLGCISTMVTALFYLGCILFGMAFSFIAAVLCCFLLFRHEAYFNGPYLPEVYAAMFSILSVVAIVRDDLKASGTAHVPAPLWIGLSAAAATLYREASALSIAPWHLYYVGRRVISDRHEAKGDLILYFSGLMILPLLFAFYLMATGAWTDYLDSIVYSRELLINSQKVGPLNWLQESMAYFNSTYCFDKLWFLLISAGTGLFLSFASSSPSRIYLALLIASLAIEILSIHSARVRFFHYFNQISWPLSLVLISPFALAPSILSRSERPMARAAARFFSLACAAGVAAYVLAASSYRYPRNEDWLAAVAAYAETLRGNSSPSERVQNIGGNDSIAILNFAQRLSATKYLDQYEWGLSESSERRKRRKAEFLALITSDPPDFMVWGVGPPFCPLSRNLLNFELMGTLRDFIEAYYQPLKTPGFEPRIFRRKKVSGTPRRQMRSGDGA